MARQEIKHAETARLIAYTVGLSEALHGGDMAQVSALAKPAAGGLSVDALLIYDMQGNEVIHFLKQENSTYLDVRSPQGTLTLEIASDLLNENNPNSIPRRTLTIDPVDKRYYYLTAIPVVFQEQVTGVVVVGTSLNVLLPLLKNTALADVIFYDESGHSIASTLGNLGEDPLSQRMISIPQTLYQSVLTTEGVVQGENIEVDKRSYSLAYGPLRVGGDTLAVFSVVLPLDFVIESGSDNRDNYIALYSVAMIAVILIGYYIARVITNPVLKLVRVSRTIAGGDSASGQRSRAG